MGMPCTANVPGSLLRKVTYDSGLDHVHFHPLAPSAQRNTLAVANLQVDRDRHLPIVCRPVSIAESSMDRLLVTPG